MREELELLGWGADPADITKPTPTLRASVKHSTNTAKPYRADGRAERGKSQMRAGSHQRVIGTIDMAAVIVAARCLNHRVLAAVMVMAATATAIVPHEP